MHNQFLEAVHQGKKQKSLYFLGILLILSYWLLLSGPIALVSQSILSLIVNSAKITYFIATSFSFVFLLALLVYVIKKIHHRNVYSLINADAIINYKRLFTGFIIWIIQVSAFTFLDILLYPQSYTYTFEPKQWFLLLPLVLIFTPVQTSVEELLYRGYLMQGLSLITKRPVILVLVTSLVFAIPHFGNPEMQRGFVWGALTYLVWGIFFAVITLKDGGLELALGVHAANNIFSFLVVNTPDSVMPSPTILTYIRPIESVEGFFSLLIQASIFYCIFFGGIPRNPKQSRV
ncbi:MAG: CPBP family intramembrane glutamic endopeptidase [Cyanobacteria bacterium P01_H01_bin.21]